MNKKTIFLLVTMAAVFLVGLGLLLYPHIRGAALEEQQREEVNQFLAAIETEPVTEPEPTGEPTEPEETQERCYSALWQDIQEYNTQIFENEQVNLDSIAAYSEVPFCLADYGLNSGEIFAILIIPAIDLEMPVYLGANQENLSMGAAAMAQTSVPIGGENTNAVIAGHRGYNGARYFRDLPTLQPGDEVEIINAWETLEYRVTEVRVVASSDYPAVLIQPGRDLLTLLTCEYGSYGMKYRCLVYCTAE